MITRVAVFCGSREGSRPQFHQAAENLGSGLAKNKIEMVYGGAKIGLMGLAADACLGDGGRVIGVMPRFLGKQEIVHDHLSELILVKSMDERKNKMLELSSAFVVLPGGWGTLDEMYEVLTLHQVGQHQKPLWLLNVAGYFDPILKLHEHMVKEGFLAGHHLDLVQVCPDVGPILQAIKKSGG